MFYKCLARPLLFRLDPEMAHELGASFIGNGLSSPLLAANKLLWGFESKRLHTNLCGIPLSNPVGLAAGFDKNARMFSGLHQLGFSFVEVGTVTAKGQSGNEKPRLFRLPADKAIINRMGFNNDGADVVSERLKQRRARVPLGGNIGKSKVTPLDEAIEDYAYSFKLLQPFVDYFVVNVSSPNTPNLRKLQAKEPLRDLLTHLMGLNHPRKPLLLKIAPDLNEHQLAEIVEVVEEAGIDGVIATNTTIERGGLQTSSAEVARIGAGGLSGKPVGDLSDEVLRFLARHLPKQVDLVGVGGIFDGADAYRKIKAGARTVQIYTGFVYGGQNTVFQICRQLDKLLEQDGHESIESAVGADL